MKEAIALLLSMFMFASSLPAEGSGDIKASLHLESDSKVNPVELLHILPPPSHFIIPKGSSLRLTADIGNESDREARVTLEITSSWQGAKREERISIRPGESGKITLNLSFPLGSHSLKAALKEGGRIIAEKEWKVICEEMGEMPPFSASYCDLRYDLPVLFFKEGKFEKKEWKEVWRNGPLSDIVVRFPSGARMVFWKGTSYIPIWAFQKCGFSYEWVEVVSPRPPEFVDCVEPLMDRECRYSRASIIQNTPARILVHWRYALCDFNYRIYEDEWVDEYYYLYPDGVGVRAIIGWLAPGVRHEMNELITVLPPATHPNDILPSNAVDFLDLEGNKQSVSWPQPRLNWPTGKPSIIRVKLKEDFHPFMVSPAITEYLAVWDGWKKNGEYVSPCYWGNHWPVTRGLNTVGYIPEGWEEGPAHASLISMNHKPFEEMDVSPSIHKTVWALLIGTVRKEEKDEKLLSLASSWLNPAELKVENSKTKSKGYDPLQRAYVLECEEKVPSIKMRMEPRGKMLHPAFVFRNLSAEVSELLLNGNKLASNLYSWGVEDEGNKRNLVLWLGIEIEKPTNIEIKLKE
ncbi:MAG: hypothetical protein ACP5KZ_07815 [bacterium]